MRVITRVHCFCFGVAFRCVDIPMMIEKPKKKILS